MNLKKLCILIILTAMAFINPAIASNPIIDIDYNIDDSELEQFSFTNSDTTSINIDNTGIFNRDEIDDDDASKSYMSNNINQLKNETEYVSDNDYYKDSNYFEYYDDYKDSNDSNNFKNCKDSNGSNYFEDYENYNDSNYFDNSSDSNYFDNYNDSTTEPINSDTKTQKSPGFSFGITVLSTMVIFKLKQN